MNIILLSSKDHWLDDHSVLLRDERAIHICDVLKANVGEHLRVGLRDGLQGQGEVQSIQAGVVHLTVELHEPPPPRHRFDLVLALPRPKMLRRIFRAVAEFGVSNLYLINSARVEKSYWQSPLLKADAIDQALVAGMERSRDTVAPRVHCCPRFRPFVEDQLIQICAGRPCWIADMDAPRALSDSSATPAVVMIGPDGGFVPFEIALAEQTTAKRVHLGNRVLSVDTALTSALAQALPGSNEP
jgi:RsmE family RNA methyltransferase